MNNTYVWSAVAVIATVTAITRFLPFVLFRHGKTPRIVEKLGRSLPYAIMGMLVVYCLRDVSFGSVNDFFPEVIACAVVGASYVWRRNTLLSIILGTVCYMVLVQNFFHFDMGFDVIVSFFSGI